MNASTIVYSVLTSAVPRGAFVLMRLRRHAFVRMVRRVGKDISVEDAAPRVRPRLRLLRRPALRWALEKTALEDGVAGGFELGVGLDELGGDGLGLAGEGLLHLEGVGHGLAAEMVVEDGYYGVGDG
jgi:hypothetical protein